MTNWKHNHSVYTVRTVNSNVTVTGELLPKKLNIFIVKWNVCKLFSIINRMTWFSIFLSIVSDRLSDWDFFRGKANHVVLVLSNVRPIRAIKIMYLMHLILIWTYNKFVMHPEQVWRPYNTTITLNSLSCW